MTPLREQIMDELMDRDMSIAEIAKQLGAHYETVRKAIRALQQQGLVIAERARPVDGKPEVIYAMARTQRSKAA